MIAVVLLLLCNDEIKKVECQQVCSSNQKRKERERNARDASRRVERDEGGGKGRKQEVKKDSPEDICKQYHRYLDEGSKAESGSKKGGLTARVTKWSGKEKEKEKMASS